MPNSSIYSRTRVLVLVPKVGTGTHGQRPSGTGTHLQNRVGTGTDQSSTGTDASNNPDFCILALISPNSYFDSIWTLPPPLCLVGAFHLCC